MTSRRWGGALWVGCLQFFVAEALAAAGFVGSYSFRRNYISDLGAVSCGARCSPLHALMNASFVLQGVLIFLGAIVVWPLFPRGALTWLALGLIAASGLGVAVVGLAPEDFAPGWHYLGAAENLLFCNAGAGLLGVALLRERRVPRAVGPLSLGLDRYDLGIMSCKGMSVTAARQLVDQTCARFKIPLYTFHDFDVSGFSIASTLHQSNRRFQFATRSGEDFKVIDFGLRLTDVERLGLASEPVSFDVSKDALRNRLQINGATKREIDFLLTGPGNTGRRVELNAMTSRQFIDYLEAKLSEHGVGKIIPSADELADAYRLIVRAHEPTRSRRQLWPQC